MARRVAAEHAAEGFRCGLFPFDRQQHFFLTCELPERCLQLHTSSFSIKYYLVLYLTILPQAASGSNLTFESC
jgi:hypothetical protein